MFIRSREKCDHEVLNYDKHNFFVRCTYVKQKSDAKKNIINETFVTPT